MELDKLYQELIIDHGTEPRNSRVLSNANHEAEGFNPLCGDRDHVYLKIDNGIITDITCISKGCAISTASGSIMTEVLKGKSLDEANAIFKDFQNVMLTDAPAPITLGKLAALTDVRKFPSRVKCATLAWHTMQEAMQNPEKK